MDIKVDYETGKLRFSPDPARVGRGEHVSWSLRAAAFARPLRWEVYFDHGTPFPGQKSFVTDTVPVDGQQAGSSSGGPAEEQGDYKYGVRVIDAVDKVTLADEDPVLIVG